MEVLATSFNERCFVASVSPADWCAAWMVHLYKDNFYIYECSKEVLSVVCGFQIVPSPSKIHWGMELNVEQSMSSVDLGGVGQLYLLSTYFICCGPIVFAVDLLYLLSTCCICCGLIVFAVDQMYLLWTYCICCLPIVFAVD